MFENEGPVLRYEEGVTVCKIGGYSFSLPSVV